MRNHPCASGGAVPVRVLLSWLLGALAACGGGQSSGGALPAADAPYDAPNAGVATAAERDAAALGRGVFSAFGALREIDAAMLDAHGFGLGDAVIGAGDTEIGGFLIRGLGAEGSGSGLDRDASSDPVPAEGR